MNYNIIIPNRSGSSGQETLSTNNNIVLVGANGSGKTRFGTKIEELNQNRITVHRISAQKALNIPDYATVKNLDQAEKELIFGRSDSTYASNAYKKQFRWGNLPETFLLNDYEKLLSLLFAKSAERDRNYTLEAMQSKQ
jgi:hypothetical protein